MWGRELIWPGKSHDFDHKNWIWKVDQMGAIWKTAAEETGMFFIHSWKQIMSQEISHQLNNGQTKQRCINFSLILFPKNQLGPSKTRGVWLDLFRFGFWDLKPPGTWDPMILRVIYMCHGLNSLYWGWSSHLNRNPYNGYINPYYWVDDHPLLYGNNGSLDPGTYTRFFRSWPELGCFIRDLFRFFFDQKVTNGRSW